MKEQLAVAPPKGEPNMQSEDVPVYDDERILTLMRSGYVVSVHIGRWGGQTRLTSEDLGIREPEDADRRQAVRELLRLGNKYLMPQKLRRKLDSIERRGRQNVRKHAISTPLGDFMTPAAFGRFKKRHTELKGEYEAVRDDILNRYEEIRSKVAEHYRQAGRVAWRRLQGLGVDADVPAGRETDCDAFVETYVERIMADFPAADYIERSFYYEYEPRKIQLPDLVESDDPELNEYWSERKRQHIDAFLAQIVGQVRGQVYDVVASAAGSLRENGYLPGKTVEGLKNLMDMIQAIDPYGDEDLMRAFAKLRGQLSMDTRDRDLDAIGRHLSDICTVTSVTLHQLDAAVTRSGNGDIDAPSEFEVKAARKRLELGEGVPAVDAAVRRIGREF